LFGNKLRFIDMSFVPVFKNQKQANLSIRKIGKRS
jgi:hypothetical protein